MAFYEGMGEKYRAVVESLSMDMWGPLHLGASGDDPGFRD